MKWPDTPVNFQLGEEVKYQGRTAQVMDHHEQAPGKHYYTIKIMVPEKDLTKTTQQENQ